jgi:AAA+ superfamily predicted ATPase
MLDPRAVQDFAGAIRDARCSLIVGSTLAPPAAVLGILTPLPMTVPGASIRAECWRKAITRQAAGIDPQVAKSLGARFSLTPAQIDSAVSAAVLQADLDSGEPDWFAAARAQSGEALAAVADKITPRATWQDLVLPEDAITQLRELCQRVEHRDRVLEEWGFGRKLSRGRGTAALFSGGSGTGKTMAAEVIANALGVDLYRIDLARVVSKYIGETEKNLSRIFDAAEGANAILLFDEADALFGKRSEVKDAHDRYANIEISYLLQRIEQYQGIAILTTNLRENLDDAFLRRLAFVVHFPLPDEMHRFLLWSRSWPCADGVDSDVDAHRLASRFKLGGGSIRNIALAASYLAASEARKVSMGHVSRAAERELQKLGKAYSQSNAGQGAQLHGADGVGG